MPRDDKNREVRVVLRDKGLEGLLNLDDPFMVREILINALDGAFARSHALENAQEGCPHGMQTGGTPKAPCALCEADRLSASVPSTTACSGEFPSVIDRDWWREKGADFCIDRMVIMETQRIVLQRELAEIRGALRRSDAENDELRQENGALSAASAIERITEGPFAGLPKPHKVPEGYVLVDEKSFKIILGVLTEEQTREICMKEVERISLRRSDGTVKP